MIEEFGLYREERKTHFEEEILEMMRKDITIAMESAMPGSSSSSQTTGGLSDRLSGNRPCVGDAGCEPYDGPLRRTEPEDTRGASGGHFGVPRHAASRFQEASRRNGSGGQLLQARTQRRTAAAGECPVRDPYQASDRTGSQPRCHQPRPTDQGDPGEQRQRHGIDHRGADAGMGTGATSAEATGSPLLPGQPATALRSKSFGSPGGATRSGFVRVSAKVIRK